MSDTNYPDLGQKPTRVRTERPKRTFDATGQIYIKNERKKPRRAPRTDGNIPREPRQRQPGLFRFILHIIYANLYILGITVLRRKLRLDRRFRRFRSRRRDLAFSRLERASRSVKWFFIRFRDRTSAPFLRIKRTCKEMRPEIEAKRAKGKIPYDAYLAILETVGRLIFKIVSTIFNYTAPIAAAIFFVVLVQQRISEPMVFSVEYNGQIIGYVENKSEFTAATQAVASRVTTTGESAFQISSPHYELMTLSEFNNRKADGEIPADAYKLEKNELTDKLIKASVSDVSEAYGLYVNNRFLGAVFDKDLILNEFESIKRKNMTGKPDEEVNFSKSIRLKPGLYPLNSIKPESDVLNVISGSETADEVYVIKEGDSPSAIADKTGVPLSVLQELNPDMEEKMFVGSEIFTQVAKPFMSVESKYTDIVEEPVEFEVVEDQNATFVKGYTNVYQQGENGIRRVKYKITSENGLEKSREELSFDIIKHPVTQRVTVGIADPTRVVTAPAVSQGSSGNSGSGGGGTTVAKPPAPTAPAVPSSTGFIRPVAPGVGYVSCGLNGYRGHTGMDIAVIGGTGTPILASASGTVVLAKNTNVGYGRYIIIDHGNGYQTLYAHNSQLYVSVGQYVQQGQVIAAMGRTGNATGVHVHFEIRYQGRIMNPANYIGNY